MGGLRSLAGLGVLLFSGLGACGGRAAVDSEGTGEPNAGGAGTIAGACANYCAALARIDCAVGKATECTPLCIKELSRQTLGCQKKGAQLLDCAIPVFERGQDCSNAEQSASAQCATAVAAYQDCAEPLPGPSPEPPSAQSDCTRSSSVGISSCSEAMVCSGGSRYEVHCKQNSDGSSSCGCSSGAFSIVDESVATACSNVLAACAPSP